VIEVEAVVVVVVVVVVVPDIEQAGNEK